MRAGRVVYTNDPVAAEQQKTNAHDGHRHSHGTELSGFRLKLALIVTVVFVAGEAFVGWRIGSLALLSDAGHNLSDGIALAISAYAVWLSAKPATAERTYGYHRAGIIAALVNAASLMVVSFYLLREAVSRLSDPPKIAGGWVIGTAAAALMVNLLISWWLHAGSRTDLNIRSVYLHMVWDAAASAGVILGGVFIIWTGSSLVDPIVSMIICGLILWSSLDVLREALHILLEAAPRQVNVEQLGEAVSQLPGVLGCHDLHVWTISSGILAASMHVVVEDQSVRDAQTIAQSVSALLERDYGISHATIQVEAVHCGQSELVCTLRRNGGRPLPQDAP